MSTETAELLKLKAENHSLREAIEKHKQNRRFMIASLDDLQLWDALNGRPWKEETDDTVG